MKSPEQLRQQLQRQWRSGAQRERLLLDRDHWPQRLAIGKPTPAQLADDLSAVRAHIQHWRAISSGRVEWQPVRYRKAAAPVELPLHWRFDAIDDWTRASGDPQLRQEQALYARILAASNPIYHPLLVRQRQLVLGRGADEMIQACALVDVTEPGCAAGRPLRALSLAGCDSKFLERNRTLVVKLLEVRFGAALLQDGLEAFLDALDDSDHWLLILPLDTGLLPFTQLRLQSSELARSGLPGSHLLVVENERAIHQLPRLPDTLVVAGAGLNLEWLGASWCAHKRIGYWGDLDTWGLTMLARARQRQPGLSPLLMDRATFDVAARHAVAEPVDAGEQPPDPLTPDEQALYRFLQRSEQGRLEQEFLASERVAGAVAAWRAGEGA